MKNATRETIVAPPTLVTELDLPAFRETYLASEAIQLALERNVHLLIRLPVGVGKSHTLDELLQDPLLYERFDLVICVAPTWAILGDRAIVSGRSSPPVPWALIEPRPRERCGPHAASWSELEKAGCATLAKATLCRECKERARLPEPCEWPDLYRNLKGKRLVFVVEQHFLINRSFMRSMRRWTQEPRILVILDEATVLQGKFEIKIERNAIDRFLAVIEQIPSTRALFRERRRDLIEALRFLRDADDDELRNSDFHGLSAADRSILRIQKLGRDRFGSGFRYIGYDLVQLAWSRPEERWKDWARTIHFIARPYLRCHVLLLSAHLSSDFAGHRLGTDPIPSPFEHTRVRHSGTRLINLVNRVGADAYFASNHRRVLDTFAVVLLRNIIEGRSTLLVAKKSRKECCAAYLWDRLKGWGVDVRIVLEGFDDLPTSPDPTVIPLIHYGVMGVNTFQDYQSCYCLTSYYVPPDEFERTVQEFEPEAFRVGLSVRAGADGIRRVELEPGAPDQDRRFLANLYLRKLEVDPVVQAAGRVRPLTKPREVVFFQMHDLEEQVGPYERVCTLSGLRGALGVPSAHDIDDLVDGLRARALMAEGRTAEAVAEEIGVSRATLFRRLRAVRESQNPYKRYFNRYFETLPPRSAEEEARS